MSRRQNSSRQGRERHEAMALPSRAGAL